MTMRANVTGCRTAGQVRKSLPAQAENFVYRACAICGGTKECLLGTKVGRFTGHLFRFVRCTACGFVFVNPGLDEATLIDLYDESYYRGNGFDPAATYLAADGAVLDHASYDNASLASRINRAARHFGIHGKEFLDIGCGFGALLDEMTKLGYRAEGIETSAFAVDKCQRSGRKVHLANDAFWKGFPKESFDVISMIEVIEHLPHPYEAVKSASELLKPGGMLYIQTGNVDHAFNPARRIASALKQRITSARSSEAGGASLLKQLGDAFDPLTWEYFSPEGHVSYFSPATLAALFKQCNLKARYLNHWSLSGLNMPMGLKPALHAGRGNH